MRTLYITLLIAISISTVAYADGISSRDYVRIPEGQREFIEKYFSTLTISAKEYLPIAIEGTNAYYGDSQGYWKWICQFPNDYKEDIVLYRYYMLGERNAVDSEALLPRYIQAKYLSQQEMCTYYSDGDTYSVLIDGMNGLNSYLDGAINSKFYTITLFKNYSEVIAKVTIEGEDVRYSVGLFDGHYGITLDWTRAWANSRTGGYYDYSAVIETYPCFNFWLKYCHARQ